MNNTTTDDAKKTIAKIFIKIFRGLPGVRGSVDGGCIKSPLTVMDVLRHLEGKESLGRYPLFDRIYVQWAAVDFDFKKSHDREALSEKTAKAYAEELFRYGFKHYWFERSKSGLIHLWLFFSEKVLAKKVRFILITIAKTLGLKIANGNVEIFPKQDELNDEHSVGNYINLPYFGALNGNKIERRAILDPNSFLPISLDEFLLRMGDTLISSLEVDAVYEFLTENESQEDPNEEKVEPESYSEVSWQVKRKKIIEILRLYWVEGNRQSLSLHLADFLGRNQTTWADTQNLILEIAALCKDDETTKRMGAVKSTYEKHRTGEKTNYKGMKAILSASDFESLVALFTPSTKTNKPQIPWPEPLDDAAFYGLAGEVVKIIEPHTEADPAALLIEFLTGFGSIIGPKPYFRVEADEHRMRINLVLVGDSSKARKGSSWGHIQRLFQTIDADWANNIKSGLSSGEGLIWAVRDQITKREPIRENKRIIDYEDVIADPGVTDKRLLVFEAEFASTLRVLGREGNTLSAVIRNAWDTGNLQTLTKNSQAKATGAHIALIAHITRQELLRYLTNTEAGNGFGNRFLWICVKRSKCLPFGGETHNINFEPLIKQLSAAVNYGSQVERIQWAEETRPMWQEIYPALSEGKPDLFGAMTARAEAYVTRLACIYALLDLSRLDPDKTESETVKDELKVVIKPEHLKAALAVWDYAEASARYIFQTATGDALTDEIISVLMANPGGMTRTAIYNHFSRHKSSEQIAAALDMLEALGRVRKETIPTEGRSTEVWFCNESHGAQ